MDLPVTGQHVKYLAKYVKETNLNLERYVYVFHIYMHYSCTTYKTELVWVGKTLSLSKISTTNCKFYFFFTGVTSTGDWQRQDVAWLTTKKLAFQDKAGKKWHCLFVCVMQTKPGLKCDFWTYIYLHGNYSREKFTCRPPN